MTVSVLPFPEEAAALGPDGELSMASGGIVPSVYEGARSIRAYHLNAIPGFLQVPGYAEAVQRTWAAILHPGAAATPHAATGGAISVLDALTLKGVNRILALGAAVLAEGKTVDLILEAAALRCGFGDEDIMRAQRAKIATVTELLPGVRVRVIPEGVRHLALSSGFQLIDDTDAYMETAYAELHVTGAREIAYFKRLFTLLEAQAVPFSEYMRGQL